MMEKTRLGEALRNGLSAGFALLASIHLALPVEAAEDPPAPHTHHVHSASDDPSSHPDVSDQEIDEETRADDGPDPGVEVIVVVGQTPKATGTQWVDLRASMQPQADGASVLEQLPGFALIRQGGSASEPVLRGLGGSRLNILIDGVPYAGACNHAMDPATTYVNPGEFDQLVVLRGPQSVRHAGAISGEVDFKRSPVRFSEPGATAYVTGLVGSFGRHEGSGDVAVGSERAYLRASGGYAEGDDYQDGKSRPVFSNYERWNGRLALGLTPATDTLLELSAEMSDGQMANATIHMDATKLDRRAYGVRFEKSWTDSWLESVELKFDRIVVDHEMDDFTLRPAEDPEDHSPATAVSLESLVMSQGWKEYQGRGVLHFEPHEAVKLELGVDVRSSDYDARAAGGSQLFLKIPPATDYELVLDNPAVLSDEPWNPIVEFTNVGAYSELSYAFLSGSRLVGGLRYDRLRTETHTMHAAGEISDVVLSGSNQDRNQDLWSGFLRFELSSPSLPIRAAVGIGHAQRGHDYWEVYSYDGFSLDPERNTELDIGAYYGGSKITADLSVFMSQIDDFILTYNGVAAANVKARRVGGEAVVSYQIVPELVASAEVSFVHATNVTQGVPLAQMPPLEGALRVRYQGEFASMGADARMVARQNRIHPDFGNRLGVDTSKTPGFVVLSLYASVKPWPYADLSFGVDNLLDNNYHEHLSRLSSPVPGFVSRDKVNEPGRRFWLRLSVDLGV
ncbi:MAG: TonB-dependent copper receptor [bacterium]|nr:TonB-dependent copper receptor [bacterium]